jgi:hypothetical protein
MPIRYAKEDETIVELGWFEVWSFSVVLELSKFDTGDVVPKGADFQRRLPAPSPRYIFPWKFSFAYCSHAYIELASGLSVGIVRHF